MAYRNFNAIYAMANEMYEYEAHPSSFEEVALNAFDRIGNKRTRTYHACLELQSDENGYYVDLPCNCEQIECVTLNWGENWKYTSNLYMEGDWNSMYNENYIESRKMNKHMLYDSGIFAKYERVGDRLYFRQDYRTVHLLYRGQMLDEDGLPYVTDKEIDAIVAFIMFVKARKDAWRLKSKESMQLAAMAEKDWMRLCDRARTPDHITQNEMDRILDAYTSFNRKRHNWSLKPLR